jgi:transcriptional regulator with XRE-family HTH domain
MLCYFKNYKLMKAVHIGSIIRQKVNERGISVKNFAKMLHYSESNAYSIFNRKSIDSELLALISEILGYDFKSEYGEPCNIDQDCIALIRTNKTKLNELLEDKSINLISFEDHSK